MCGHYKQRKNIPRQYQLFYLYNEIMGDTFLYFLYVVMIFNQNIWHLIYLCDNKGIKSTLPKYKEILKRNLFEVYKLLLILPSIS